MKKRFFQPIWKFEEIEKQLVALEESGWRLDKIKGFRCFKFVKSTPKTVRCFFTYTLIREKLNMNLIENTLVQKFNANQIKGDFFDDLGVASVFRITKQAELTEQLNNRDIILQHYLLKKVVLGIILFLFLVVPLIFAVAVDTEKFLEDSNIFYSFFIGGYFLFTVSYMIYNLIGFGCLNKKLKNK